MKSLIITAYCKANKPRALNNTVFVISILDNIAFNLEKVFTVNLCVIIMTKLLDHG